MTNKRTSVYDFSAPLLTGVEQPLSEYKGNVILIVNVASLCGFTSQYRGLSDLFQCYQDKGFTVLAFPCNQFGGQEPGNSEQISQVCQVQYRVNFPVFSKVAVNGKDAHPLYQYLKQAAPGIAGTTRIKWNFTKFLIDKSGHVVSRYAPRFLPANLAPAIEKLL